MDNTTPQGLREQAMTERDDRMAALMAAADERQRQVERLAARVDPGRRAKVERPEPSPRDKFGGCRPLSRALTEGSPNLTHAACGRPLSEHVGIDALGVHYPPITNQE